MHTYIMQIEVKEQLNSEFAKQIQHTVLCVAFLFTFMK